MGSTEETLASLFSYPGKMAKLGGDGDGDGDSSGLFSKFFRQSKKRKIGCRAAGRERVRQR